VDTHGKQQTASRAEKGKMTRGCSIVGRLPCPSRDRSRDRARPSAGERTGAPASGILEVAEPSRVTASDLKFGPVS
jgi:hypothetical protein